HMAVVVGLQHGANDGLELEAFLEIGLRGHTGRIPDLRSWPQFALCGAIRPVLPRCRGWARRRSELVAAPPRPTRHSPREYALPAPHGRPAPATRSPLGSAATRARRGPLSRPRPRCRAARARIDRAPPACASGPR